MVMNSLDLLSIITKKAYTSENFFYLPTGRNTSLFSTSDQVWIILHLANR